MRSEPQTIAPAGAVRAAIDLRRLPFIRPLVSAYAHDFAAVAPLFAGNPSAPAAWRDTRSPVLAVHGSDDWIAYSREDHELIARLVNNQRPGTARFVSLEGLNHGMASVAAGQNGQRAYDPAFTDLIADWIEEIGAAR